MLLGSWSETFIFSWYVMVPLMLCSIISLAIIFERILSLRSDVVIKPSLARAIHDLGYGGKTTLVEQESVDEETALSRLVRACLMYTSWPKDENAEAVQAYARREIVRLERGLVFLEVVTGLGPLLGLMGTILGLIRIFSSAGNSAELSAQSAQIAAGIAEAMYCTVAGLIVAIPALIAHSLFSRHIEALTIDLETLCSELLGKLYTQSEGSETAQG
jgi:biopolymer transport protein ExbB